jgi:hypothetical protein
MKSRSVTNPVSALCLSLTLHVPLKQRIINAEYTIPEGISLSEACKDLLSKLFKVKPEEVSGDLLLDPSSQLYRGKRLDLGVFPLLPTSLSCPSLFSSPSSSSYLLFPCPLSFYSRLGLFLPSLAY